MKINKKPDDFFEKELKKVEVSRKYALFSDIGLIEGTIYKSSERDMIEEANSPSSIEMMDEIGNILSEIADTCYNILPTNDIIEIINEAGERIKEEFPWHDKIEEVIKKVINNIRKGETKWKGLLNE